MKPYIGMNVRWLNKNGKQRTSIIKGEVIDFYYDEGVSNDRREGWRLLISTGTHKGELVTTEKYFDEIEKV